MRYVEDYHNKNYTVTDAIKELHEVSMRMLTADSFEKIEEDELGSQYLILATTSLDQAKVYLRLANKSVPVDYDSCE